MYKQDMLRKLSAITGQIAKESAKNIAAQQTPLNLLAQVVFNNSAALEDA